MYGCTDLQLYIICDGIAVKNNPVFPQATAVSTYTNTNNGKVQVNK